MGLRNISIVIILSLLSLKSEEWEYYSLRSKNNRNEEILKLIILHFKVFFLIKIITNKYIEVIAKTDNL